MSTKMSARETLKPGALRKDIISYMNVEVHMTQDQFDRESNFRLSFAIFQKLFNLGLLTADQLAEAREKLVERFQPPIACLPDILAAEPM